MAAIASFVEGRKFKERVVCESAHRGGPPVYRLQFSLEEAGKAPERFAGVDVDVLSFSGAVAPQGCGGDRLGGQADRGRCTEPVRAGNDGVSPIERKASSAVRRSQSDVAQDIVRVRQ